MAAVFGDHISAMAILIVTIKVMNVAAILHAVQMNLSVKLISYAIMSKYQYFLYVISNIFFIFNKMFKGNSNAMEISIVYMNQMS